MSIASLIEYDHQHPAGWGTTLEEKLFLYSLVRMLDVYKVIEIGVRCGHSSCWLAEALRCNAPDARLYAVDNWKSAPKKVAVKRLLDCGLLKFTHVVSMDSLKFLQKQKPASAGLVFIDGDHSYEAAKADIEEALRVSRKAVLVHDADSIPSVRQACLDIGGGLHLRSRLPKGRGMWLWIK